MEEGQKLANSCLRSLWTRPKDSFLRALREVAPEMELFLENHWQYMKNLVTLLIYMQSCTFRHFTKKIVP